jgi:amino acid adenylation domain-containing protein
VLDQISQSKGHFDAATISRAKRELLAKYLRGDLAAQPATNEIPRRASNAPLQLSFAQERLWFLDQLMPGSPVFNVPTAVRISRPLDLEVLQRCVDEIIQRHEVLRSTFVTIDGKPAPVVNSQIETRISVVDLTQLDHEAREAESLRLTQEAALRSFDLARGPLIRTALIRLTESDSIFLLTMHHIVSDGSSILIFFRELSALYDAYANGRVSPLATLSIQYPDYAQWQKNWLNAERVESQLAYWKEKLRGELPTLEMPGDRPRPASQTYCGGRVTTTLSAELTAALYALSQGEHATLFMTLLAAFKVLLHRHSRLEDLIVGTPIANRSQTGTENLIGLFLNNLALRTDLSGDPGFRELLSRVRETALDAYANQDVAFERLIEELKPERDVSRTSIFQVYFNLFSFSDKIDLPDGRSINFVDAWLQSEENLSKFDLTLYAGADDRQIQLALVYNADLFAAERMTEMLAQFQHLLSQIILQPDERISRLSLVTPSASEVLPNPIEPINSHEDKSIIACFSEQARRRPAALAVSDQQESWTYEELDRSSNQLANYLRANGINNGEVVAIYAHRSAPLVVAILGVLKSGAAFTILDPAYPAARLTDCLEIARPRGWIQIEAAGALPATLEEYAGAIDCRVTLRSKKASTGDTWMQCSSEIPPLLIQPDDLAYIAFTSGSTGQPKGVMGRHGPLTLFTSWATPKFELDERDRFCLLSGLAHDPLHRDIFTPLQLGGAICIPDPKDLEAPNRLRAWVSGQAITVANLTPAMSQLLTDGAEGTQITSLRYSFLVGDVLTKRDVARLRQLAPAITCVNLYGSTETQRAVGHYVIERANNSPAKDVLPLGKGIRDTQLLVLNESQQLCGVSELGEIYFRSPHLAKGYLGDDDLTRARFITNPFTKDPADRLYRTGDLGRYQADGNVEHAGRADRQIKIRGFRIEPSEIEAAITRHPDVREAVVIAQENDSERFLAAYVVPSGLVSLRSLRDWLADKLPAYMIPSSIVLIESLPLTSNGKLDRRALPLLDREERAHEFVAPRSQTESVLLAIWKEVLPAPQISIHDNFFELGGYSLLAVRLFALIEKRLGQRLPLATLFQAPTIAELAAILEEESAPASSSLVPIQPFGARPPFFCVHAVGGNVLEYYELARHLGTDQPFYGLQSLGLNDSQEPQTRIEDMAAHYVREITAFQPSGPYFIGGRSLGGIIAYEMARQLREQQREVRLVALLDSYPVGHQKLMTQPAAPTVETNRFFRRIRTHISNLGHVPWREKFKYVFSKLQYAPKRMKSIAWRAMYRACRKAGFSIPRSLRNVEQFNWLAAHEFVPRLYDGAVTLFWASSDLRAKFDMIEGWKKLAPGGLAVHEIPGTHLDIIKEPHVAAVAKMLSESLNHKKGLSTE